VLFIILVPSIDFKASNDVFEVLGNKCKINPKWKSRIDNPENIGYKTQS